MRFTVLAAVLLCFLPNVYAQQCTFGGDKAFQATRTLLTEAATCTDASRILEKCAWGSSADVELSSIVVEKCEASFLKRLTVAQESRYKEKMELCGDKYAGMQGTISISAASLCKARVAADFEHNPIKASAPIPRASYDCDRANTSLEHTICSNRELGIADLNLAEAYKSLISASSREQRRPLIEDERKWLKALAPKCQISTKSEQSDTTIQCLVAEFRARFQFLDSCSMGGPDECINAIEDTKSLR